MSQWIAPALGALIIVAAGVGMAWLMIPRRIPGHHAPDHIPLESEQWAEQLHGMGEDVANPAAYDTSVHQTEPLADEPVLEPSLPPWWERPVLEDEPAPLYYAIPMPVLALDPEELSITKVWNRAAVLAKVNELEESR